METRIPQLPPNVAPIDQVDSFLELAIPDPSSDTLYSSVRIPVQELTVLVSPPAVSLFNYYNFI